MKKYNLHRRAFLQGAGVALALPLLDIMESASAFAQAATKARHFFCLYHPNGTHGTGYDGTYPQVDPFDPVGSGTGYNLPEALSALAAYKSDLLLFRNLHNNVTLNSSGDINPHARGSAGLLTCHRTHTNPADGVKNGISLDQVIAPGVGAGVKFPSLVINNPAATNTSAVDSVFWNNISWNSTSKPTPYISDPRALFDKLFAGPSMPVADTEAQKRRFYKQSIIDATKESLSRLTASVGAADKVKLDEHLTSIRAIELKLQAEAQQNPPANTCNGGTRPTAAFSGNNDLTQWIDIMVDLSVLALRCDLTRSIVLSMDIEGSNRNMSFMGAVGDHHDISHHLENNKTAELKKVNKYYVDRFKRALDGMKGNGSNENLLNTGLAMFATPFSNGNYHNASNLPIVLAGNGNGTLLTGRGHVLPQTPVANLYMRILKMYGLNPASFGNSTGVLNI